MSGTNPLDPQAQNARQAAIEAAYEADGRHDPEHPRHAIFTGLVTGPAEVVVTATSAESIAVQKLMADATGHTIAEFTPANRVVFVTTDGEAVVVESPEPLMAALEKEFGSCLHSLSAITWVKDLDEDTAGWRFEDLDAAPEDPNASWFLFTEAGRYLDLMRSVATAFDADPYDLSRLSELAEHLARYQQAVEHAMRQEEEEAATDG